MYFLDAVTHPTSFNICSVRSYFLSDLQAPVNPETKKLKLKSLLTNPSLVDTKPGNTIELIKLIGLVCPARGLTCQSNMDVCAVTNSGNGFSFPLEVRVEISLTAVHVIGQACADCSCQSISEEFSQCFYTFEVSMRGNNR